MCLLAKLLYSSITILCCCTKYHHNDIIKGWYSFKATKAYFQMPYKAMIVFVIVTAFSLGLLEPSSV